MTLETPYRQYAHFSLLYNKLYNTQQEDSLPHTGKDIDDHKSTFLYNALKEYDMVRFTNYEVRKVIIQ